MKRINLYALVMAISLIFTPATFAADTIPVGVPIPMTGWAAGSGSDYFKGLELPGWAPRGTPGMGLAYMTADRGACHQRGFMVTYELAGKLYHGKPVDTYSLSQKAEILIGEQDYLAGLDTLVKCDFGAFGITPERYAMLFKAATGLEVDAAFFQRVGERIWNQIRLYNLREGITAKEDFLPRRIVSEPLPGGPHKGRRISNPDMNRMLADYYTLRGWDDNGRPADEKLQALSLDKKQRFDCGSPCASDGNTRDKKH